MPVLITSGRKSVRSKNDRTTGVNGYVGSSMENGVAEINGFLVATDESTAFPYTVDVTSSGASGGEIIERASMSAKYGERINFSVTAIKLDGSDYPSIASALVVGTSNLGLTTLWCDTDVTEFSTNFSLNYTGPGCGGKIKVNGVSGSRTGYGTTGDSMSSIPSICPGASYETSEYGVDYSTEEGARDFCTQEIMSVTGVPWDGFYGGTG